MRTTIDPAGRVVIPKRIREAAHLEPGTELEVRLVEGVVEIAPVGGGVRIEKRGQLLVAVPEGKRLPLTRRDVESTRGHVHGERNSRALSRDRRRHEPGA